MAGHFKKKVNTKEEIPTASLPDIIFMLLIFFMVTTVLRETELKVRITLPEAEAIEKIEQKRLVSYIYIGPQTGGPEQGELAIQIDDAIVPEVADVQNIMYQKVLEEPRTIISFRVDQDAETGMLYDVQQELREADLLRINYSSRRELVD
jgi:biopolymer transport protein ExbD